MSSAAALDSSTAGRCSSLLQLANILTWVMLASAVALITLFDEVRADASKTQCTCRLSDGMTPGSEAVNAAACVLDHFGDWCDVYIEALEGSPSHQIIVRTLLRANELALSGNAEQLRSFLLDLFDDLAAATEQSSQPDRAEAQAADREGLESLIRENIAILSECIALFEKQSSGSMIGENTSCHVAGESGWLIMQFRVNERRYSYHFAPGQ